MIHPKDFEKVHNELGFGFSMFMIEDDLEIPLGATIFFQVPGEDDFNRYERDWAARTTARGEKVVFIHTEGLSPGSESLISPRVVSFSDAA